MGVVASSRVVALAISPQRFTQCCDPLTLRLFARLRVQHSATGVVGEVLRRAGEAGDVMEAYREVRG